MGPGGVVEACCEFIKRAEGFSAEPYPDAGGWSVGYGFWSKEKPKPMTKEEADRLLRERVEWLLKRVEAIVRVPLLPEQLVALVSLAYNIGIERFAKSTLVKLLREERFEEAVKEFSKWIYVGGKPHPGLVARRKKEADLFLKGMERDEGSRTTA